MQTNRLHRLSLLFVILIAHTILIWSWQSSKSAKPQSPPTDKLLFLISAPTINSTLKPTSNSKITAVKLRANKIVSSNAISSSPGKKIHHSNELNISTETNNSIDSASETSPTPLTIQKNIRDLSKSLKDEFLKQEKNFQPESYSKQASMKKFSNAIADAAQIPREGLVIEKKFAYDGRPVSKVKTPYGIYCIRHPKAGEKLELSPPPLPVSCGQL